MKNTLVNLGSVWIDPIAHKEFMDALPRYSDLCKKVLPFFAHLVNYDDSAILTTEEQLELSTLRNKMDKYNMLSNIKPERIFYPN